MIEKLLNSTLFVFSVGGPKQNASSLWTSVFDTVFILFHMVSSMKLFDKICRLPPCLSLECVCEPAEWNETWPIICGALWALIVAAVHWIFLITFAPESCGGHGQQKQGASGLVQQLHVAKPASKASFSSPKAKTSRPIATSNCKIQGIDFTLV